MPLFINYILNSVYSERIETMQVMRRVIRVKNSNLGGELTRILQKLWVNTLENSHNLLIIFRTLSTFATKWGWEEGEVLKIFLRYHGEQLSVKCSCSM